MVAATRAQAAAPSGQSLLTAELRTYFLAQARRQGVARPNSLWKQSYEAVDGGGVIDFIWQRAEISNRDDLADRRRLMRALRKSGAVLEARVVIKRFLGDLKTLRDGDWEASDITKVQRNLKVQACHVYPCKSADG